MQNLISYKYIPNKFVLWSQKHDKKIKKYIPLPLNFLVREKTPGIYKNWVNKKTRAIDLKIELIMHKSTLYICMEKTVANK